MSSPVSTPELASFVALMTVNKSGRSTGNASTGNRVPFVLALEIIAAIIVDADTNPKFPSTIVIKNAVKFTMLKPVIIMKSKNITIFSE